MIKATMPQPIGWITDESIGRLDRGGNDSKGTVPIHKSRSYVAKTPVLLTAQAEAYATSRAREALEEAIDKVAFHGGSVEIEAAIRALLRSTPA